MKIAITGASGHIGNCIVRELLIKGNQVKVLVHSFRNGLDNLGVEIVEGNLLEPASVRELCRGADVVFHLAARIAIDNRTAEMVYAVNVTGTRNIIEAVKSEGVRKLIHFSSIDAFQSSPEINIDESSPLIDSKESIYGYSKAEGERLVKRAAEDGLDAVILSPTAVMGPHDHRQSLLGQAIKGICSNKLPFLISGGFSWVDVRDVAAASLQAIESGRGGEKYILSGTFCTLKELSYMISKLSGCRIPFLIPVSFARLACPFFQVYSSVTGKDAVYTQKSLDLLVNSPLSISNEKARKELNYHPRPLETTLKDTIEWYRLNKYI